MTIGRELAERHGSALAAVVPAAGAEGVMLLDLGHGVSPDAMDAVVVPSRDGSGGRDRRDRATA